MPKVTEEYKKKKRQQILESAKKCFSENGYQSTTIDDIIKDSKISKGTVYNYFKNKEELYLSLYQQSADYAIKGLKSSFEEVNDPKEQLRILFNGYSSMDVTDPEWLKMQQVQGEFWSNASRIEDLGHLMVEHSERVINVIAEVFESGKESGVFSHEEDSGVLAEVLLSLADGMITHLLVLQDSYPFEELLKMAESMFLDFVTSNEEAE